jgi:hypothetical protein
MSVVSNQGASRPLVVTRDGSSEDVSPKESQTWCFRLVPEEKVCPVSNVDALGPARLCCSCSKHLLAILSVRSSPEALVLQLHPPK